MIRVVGTAEIQVKSELIVACMGFDWGDCVINDPASDRSRASSKCTTCCASVSSACISTSITSMFDFEMFVCARWSSAIEIMFCAHCPFGLIVFTITESVISLISERSVFWWLIGWWSVNTHTVFWGDDEDEWWLWWVKSLWWVVRISTQGSIRFPRWCSALPQSSHFPGPISPGDSSFGSLSVQKQI